MPTPVEQIKDKLDIVEFLRGYLTLQPAGRNFRALCPFHKEKTPSFMVSPERQSWHCFGCGIGGDTFAFLMRYENIEFGEALRILAEKTGVELRRLNPAEHRQVGVLLDLNRAAADFFRKQLGASAGAREYLANRGLKESTIEEFEIGFAPNEPEALLIHLLKQNARPDDVIQAGLAVKTERGSRLDRFRGRIMFPIHDHFGKVVGFTGRIMPELEKGNPATNFVPAKYVNSAESPIFNKSKILYGFWKTKNAVRESGQAFLVEGQMDFLMAWQAGVVNVVATSGTALTGDHLRTLRRLTDRLILGLDSDTAGLAAGERAIQMAEAADFEVRTVTFGAHKDPGEMGRVDPAGLRELIAAAKPAPEFYFGLHLPTGEFDPGSREHLLGLRAILRKLQAMASAVQREYWQKELARRTGLTEKVLLEETEQLGASAEPVSAAETVAPAARNFSRREVLSQRLLAVLAAQDDWSLLGEARDYLASGYTAVLSLLERGERKAAAPAVDELLNLILLRSAEVEAGELETIKDQLAQEYARDRRRELAAAIKQAEQAGDEARLRAALAELDRLPTF